MILSPLACRTEPGKGAPYRFDITEGESDGYQFDKTPDSRFGWTGPRSFNRRLRGSYGTNILILTMFETMSRGFAREHHLSRFMARFGEILLADSLGKRIAAILVRRRESSLGSPSARSDLRSPAKKVRPISIIAPGNLLLLRGQGRALKTQAVCANLS